MKERRGSDMRQEDNDNSPVKKLETRFMLVEKRIRALLDENGTLAARVSELEQALAQARNDARQLQEYQGKTTHIRKKVENVLQTLESIVSRKQD
jgi:predicted component of type VI protein secretion system